jgi:hypothetical protein
MCPRKKKFPFAPMDTIEQTSLTISSMEVAVNKIDGPIFIENLARSIM